MERRRSVTRDDDRSARGEGNAKCVFTIEEHNL